MTKIKQLLYQLAACEYTGLGLLVLISLILHFSIIMQPVSPVFDESFYVTDARYILQGAGTDRIEHPPLGKLFIALGMFLFGDNPFGWRFFSVLFGTAAIILFYLICRRLAMSRQSTLLASTLLAFENMTFVQAGVAMLDVYSVTLMMASFWFYLKGRHIAAGVSAGLSTLAKLSGALTPLVIFFHWLMTGRKSLRRFATLIVLAPVSFMALMPFLDFAMWHRFTNPISEIKTMLGITINSTLSSDPAQKFSLPWDWVLKPESMVYWASPHYISMISPTVWALIIPVICYLIYEALKRNNTAIWCLSWFAGTYLVWLPISLLTSRQSYIYYFYPVVGSICIGLAAGLSRLSSIRWSGFRVAAKLIVPGYLLVHLGTFIFVAPVSPYWSVPLCVAFYVCFRYLFSQNRPESAGAL